MTTDTLDLVHAPAPSPTQTPEQAARLNAIALEQGITGPTNLETIGVAGKDLWVDDSEFDAFLEAIREIRAQKE